VSSPAPYPNRRREAAPTNWATIRWSAGKADDIRKHTVNLVALAPEVILVGGGTVLPSLLQATRSVPIVFVQVVDAVGAGFVDSLSRPGGNATGFTSFEYGLSGKWLELLKQIAPRVTRVGVIRDATIAAGTGLFGAIQAMAPSLGVEVSPLNVRDAAEIERAVTAFGRSANSGLIVTAGALVRVQRLLIVGLAARHKLPAVYWERTLVADGGLMSYGPDFIDQYRQAAGYVDRILKGEKPADLPVQAPTKYELVINLKTAKALGLEVPPTLLARHDPSLCFWIVLRDSVQEHDAPHAVGLLRARCERDWPPFFDLGFMVRGERLWRLLLGQRQFLTHVDVALLDGRVGDGFLARPLVAQGNTRRRRLEAQPRGACSGEHQSRMRRIFTAPIFHTSPLH
jgi:putative tryptophan/tyrosine transport system substrate-binding protein